MNGWTFVFLFLVALHVAVELWLLLRQATHVERHRDRVPEPFREAIPPEAHRKAADYTRAKLRLDLVALLLQTALLLFLTLGGGIETIDRFWRGWRLSPIPHGVALILSTFWLIALAELPIQIYRIFRVEERFGFNRMTPAQFLRDLLLQWLLALLIGAPFVALLLWVMGTVAHWWLWAWLLIVGFSLLMSWAYPTLIAPLFNRFTPLGDPELRREIETLARRCGFDLSGIFVMDASRRTRHGNAYFTGFGKSKRIVLFDTLLETLSDREEILAVLAHELGHFKKRHLWKLLALNGGLALLALYLLFSLSRIEDLFHGLGVSRAAPDTALLLFLLIAPLFGTFLSPIIHAVSRRFEFEADRFAAQLLPPEALVRALVHLYRDNAATLTPDPLYAAYHYSHPPALERIDRLQGGA